MSTEVFLRPVPLRGRPRPEVPPGHRCEPAGTWRGRPMEVVYDPRRHDVALVSGISEKVRGAMVANGWQQSRSDGGRELWVRDRAALARSRLAHEPVRRRVPRIA